VTEEDGEKPRVTWVTVGPEHAGQRVDNFLRTHLKGAPKSLIYRILRKGEVRVNKGRVKADARLCEGDVVRVPPLRLSEDVPVRVGGALEERLRAAVLYEDDSLLVLDKPPGLAVHAGSGVKIGVIEALRALYPELPGLELAHRLDRETSGVLVLAKDRPTLLFLHELMRGDAANKRYVALVHGAFPSARASVDAPLEKNTLRGGERIVRVDEQGKPALTRFRVLERLRDATLIEATLVTGRTHQIRVHTAHVGHPIVGDDKYGDAELDRALGGAPRLCLHAARLDLPRPGQKTLRLEAPLPTDLEALIDRLRA
jgi:23S rRNA pseudouridine955/2504/2580 synthase